MESYLDVNLDVFQQFKNAAANEPVIMLNLLKYKERVEETGETGKEAYNSYMTAASPFLKKAEAKVLFFGAPMHMLIGPVEEELWDAVIVVQYNSFEHFVGMATAEGYPSHLRKRALVDSRLIHCKSFNTP